MSERITASPVSGRRSVDIEVTSEKIFFNGGYEVKRYVTGRVGSVIMGRTVHLVERGITTESAEYAKKWQLLKNAGLPVVPTLRTSSRDTVLVTDLTHDGSEIYGKGKWGDIVSRQYPYQLPKAIHDVFLEVTAPVNFPQIKNRVQGYVDQANEASIALPYDDPFELLVRPNGTWSLIILDVYHAYTDPIGGAFMQRENKKHAENFLLELKEMNRIFKALQYDRDHKTRTVDGVLSEIRRRYLPGTSIL